MRVAAGRRHLRRGHGVAGLRAVQRTDRARPRGDHDDGPDHRPAAAGRRAQRPLRPAAHHGRRRHRARPGRGAPGAALADAASSSCGTSRALAAFYGGGTAFFSPSFDALVPEVLPADDLAQANALDQFVRPIALRLAGPALGGVLIDVLGAGTAFAVDAASFAVSAIALLAMAPGVRAAGRGGGRHRHGGHRGRPALHPQPRVAVGDVRERRDRLPALHGAGRGAAALRRQERPARIGGGPRHRLRRGRHRLGGLRGAARPARPAPARHHLHVRHLDAGHAGRRRLRPVHRRVAADARQPGLQRAGDGRHDRVGDGQAAPCPGRAAGPRLEPRLAHLDRPAAAVLRAHRAGERRPRARARR